MEGLKNTNESNARSLIERNVEGVLSVEFFPNHVRIAIDNQKDYNVMSSKALEKIKFVVESLEGQDIEYIVFHSGTPLNPKKEASFSQGASVSEMSGLNPDEVLAFSSFGQEVMNTVERSSKITMAAISGFCIGGGLELAMSCRRRIASPKSKFAMPENKLSICPGWGGTQRLQFIVGASAAEEMLRTGDWVTAEKARQLGLVDLVVENPMEEVGRIVQGEVPLPSSQAKFPEEVRLENPEEFETLFSTERSSVLPKSYAEEAALFSSYFKEGTPEGIKNFLKKQSRS